MEKQQKKLWKNKLMVNSETQHECWFIENPNSKELTKKITLKLGPSCEQEFIIVLKAPSKCKKKPLVSFLNLELQGVDEEQLEWVWRRDHKDMSFSKFERKKWMQVLVCGVIEPPKLSCPKSVHDDWAGKKLIPIALK